MVQTVGRVDPSLCSVQGGANCGQRLGLTMQGGANCGQGLWGGSVAHCAGQC